MSESHIGKIHSDETKRKISEASIGKTHADEAKIKMRNSSPNKKTCIVLGVSYMSLNEAARQLEISIATTNYRIK